MAFKKDFVWGAATASFQVEGAAFEDGKGLSVWDVFCERGGKVYQNHTGEVACDHYHRLEEDLDLMKELGLKAYRFSVSWPRILPMGTGQVNPKGIDFYNRLIDGLIERGITPFMTLFHWDLPYELYLKGAWLNSDMSDYFAEYAGVIAENFGDRVKHYFTLNEPQVFVGLGNMNGEHAPGNKLGERDLMNMIHNSLLAHGKAVKVLRDKVEDAKIGMAPVGFIATPASDSPEDLAMAKHATFGDANEEMDINQIIWSSATWNEPAVFGQYIKPVRKMMDKYVNRDIDADLAIIQQPMDFMGVNIYQSWRVSSENGEFKMHQYKTGYATTHMGWPVTEEATYYGPMFLHERYKLPLYITENGLALPDWKSVDGKVHDPNRIDFLTRYIGKLREATDDGADVAGYFQWSFMDNFEWAFGYEKRFGLVHCDYETLERTPKDSYYWYKEVIKNNFANVKTGGDFVV